MKQIAHTVLAASYNDY